VELSKEQNIFLVRDYVKNNFVDSGMCADICIHDKNDGNPHAHILLTMRPIEPSGEWGAKSKKEYILDKNGEKIRLKSGEFKTVKINATDWNEQTKAEEWRAAWAESVNAALERNEHAERVDHRSYERQGVERIPTVHMGVATTQMEQRGIITERGDQNREIALQNNLLQRIVARIKQLKDWLKEAVTPVVHNSRDEKPSIMAQLKKYEQQIKEVKNAQPSTLPMIADAYARLDRALEKVKHLDMRMKNANGLDEWDKLSVERKKAYNEYSAIKAEVKKLEANFPQRKPKSRDWER